MASIEELKKLQNAARQKSFDTPPPLRPGFQELDPVSKGMVLTGREPMTPKEGAEQFREMVTDPGNYRMLAEEGALTLAPMGRAFTKGGKLLELGERALRSGGAGAGASLLSETFDPSEEPVKEALATGAVGVVTEGAGAVAAKLLAPFAKTLERGAATAKDIISRYGGTLTPAKATHSRLLDIAESIGEVSIIGGGRVRKTYEKAQDAATQAVNDIADGFRSTASKEETGALIQEMIQDKLDAFKLTSAGLYKRVDKLTEGVGVPTAGIKKLAAQIQKEMDAGLRKAAPGAQTIIDDILAKGDSLTFEQAQVLRSDLLDVARSSTDILGNKAKATGRRLSKALDREMNEAAKNIGDQAIDAWRQANSFYKKGAKEFNSTMIKALAKKDPEAVFDAAIRNGRPGTIRKVLNIVDRKDWKAIQGQFLDDVLRKATDPNTLEVSASAIERRLKSFGEDSFKALFPDPRHRKNFKEVVNALRLAQTKTKDPSMSFAVRIMQVGPALSILFNSPYQTDLDTAAGVFATPAALAYLMTNPKAAKWLSVGLKAPAGSKLAARAVTNLTGLLAKEKLMEMNDG